jgi:hypothetical protein
MDGRSASRFLYVVFAIVIVATLFLAATGMAFAAGKTRYEQTSGSIVYTPVWNPDVPSPSLSDGSYSWTNSGGTATFSFTGTGVDWIGRRQVLFGIAEVKVDTGAWEEVDLYSTTDAMNVVVWSKTGLGNGPHTLVIRWTGRQSPASTQGIYYGGFAPHNPAALVAIDAFDVYTPSPATGVPASSGWSLGLLAVGGLAVAATVIVRRQMAA